MSDWKKEWELREMTCNALLLQFKEPKVYDLSIPSSYHIYSLVVIAGDILNGKVADPKEVNCVTTHHSLRYGGKNLQEHHLSSLNQRVSKNLFNILYDPQERESHLHDHMSNRTDLFRHEWHYGDGDWYEFRTGKREEIEKEVKKFWTLKEFDDFERIGKLFQPYIGLTNSAYTPKNS